VDVKDLVIIKEQQAEIERLTRAKQELLVKLEQMTTYANKLAAGLPEGMLPKDVEVLRDANVALASENEQLTREIDRTRLYDTIAYANKVQADEIRELRAKVAQLTRERDEARTELAERREQVDIEQQRWDELNVKYERLRAALDLAKAHIEWCWDKLEEHTGMWRGGSADIHKRIEELSK
jgi:DNA repair exonuclease SbcCD ATPase subunit